MGRLTFSDLHIRQILPLIHSHKPRPILSATTQINNQFFLIPTQRSKHLVKTLLRESARGEEVRCHYHLLPLASRLLSNSPRENPRAPAQSRRKHTFPAPLSIHFPALSPLTPPPTCNPPLHSATDRVAASSFPGPSIITWPPSNRFSLYSLAKCSAGRGDMKFVFNVSGEEEDSVPPMICFTAPA